MIPQAKIMTISETETNNNTNTEITTENSPWEILPTELKLMILANFLFPSATNNQLTNYLLVNREFLDLFKNGYKNQGQSKVPLIVTFYDNKLTIKSNPEFKAENTTGNIPKTANAAIGRVLKIVSDEKPFSHKFGSYVNSNLLLKENIMEYSIAGMNANYSKPACMAFKKSINLLAKENLITLNNARIAKNAIEVVENTVTNNVINVIDAGIRSIGKLFPSS